MGMGDVEDGSYDEEDEGVVSQESEEVGLEGDWEVGRLGK